jgi:hypothetical protein
MRKYGFEDSQIDERTVKAQFAKNPEPAESSVQEAAVVNPSTNGHARTAKQRSTLTKRTM